MILQILLTKATGALYSHLLDAVCTEFKAKRFSRLDLDVTLSTDSVERETKWSAFLSKNDFLVVTFNFPLSGQSFRIDNLPENPPNRDRTGGNSSSVSTSYDSDGSFEGTYNFAAEDDEIDEQMFAGDRNSTPFGDSRHLYGDPTKLNVAQTTSTEFTEGGGIRLENYKPRVSPLLSPKDGTTV